MSDERTVEAVSDRLRPMWVEIPDDPAPVMRWALAALRAEGYEIYRPDDCASVFVDSCLRDHEGCRWVEEQVPHSPPGSYSLVPVGGEG